MVEANWSTLLLALIAVLLVIGIGWEPDENPYDLEEEEE